MVPFCGLEGDNRDPYNFLARFLLGCDGVEKIQPRHNGRNEEFGRPGSGAKVLPTQEEPWRTLYEKAQEIFKDQALGQPSRIGCLYMPMRPES